MCFIRGSMLPCGPGNAVMRNGAFIGTTTESGPRCAATKEPMSNGSLTAGCCTC